MMDAQERCMQCGMPFTGASLDKRDGQLKCRDCARSGVLNQAGVFVVSASSGSSTYYKCKKCGETMEPGQRVVRNDSTW